jgi:hypothetical protein
MCISIQKLARCVPIVHKLASQVQIHTKSCETNTWHATSAENNVGVLASKSFAEVLNYEQSRWVAGPYISSSGISSSGRRRTHSPALAAVSALRILLDLKSGGSRRSSQRMARGQR